MKSENQNLILPNKIEPVFQKHNSLIDSFAYITPDLKNINDANTKSAKISDNARINSIETGIYAT